MRPSTIVNPQAKHASEELLQNFEFPEMDKIDCYKLPFAIEEAAERFGRENLPSALYSCNNSPVYLINEDKLDEKQKSAFRKIRSQKTKIPFVYYLMIGEIIKVPVERETLSPLYEHKDLS